MGNQTVTSEIREYFHACFVQNKIIYLILEETQVKLFSNFTSMQFYSLLISLVKNEAHNL